MKTSWRGLSSSSSEDVLKTSLRCLDQDEYVRLSLTSSEDVFKTTSSRPIYSSWPYIFKTSSRRFQDVFKTSCQYVFKTSSRHLQDVFKTPLRRFEDVFKTSPRRLAKMSSRRFQDVLSSYTVLVNKFSRCLQDVFTTFLRCTSKTVTYRRICLGHTSEKFMISVQNLQGWQQFLKF